MKQYIPNIASIIRLILAPLPLIALAHHWLNGWGALVLFAVAALLDAFDGWFARRYHTITQLGKILDPLADKVLVVSTLIGICVYVEPFKDSFWGWLIPVEITLRELLVVVLRVRKTRAKTATSLTGIRKILHVLDMSVVPSNVQGKTKMILQSAATILALTPWDWTGYSSAALFITAALFGWWSAVRYVAIE